VSDKDFFFDEDEKPATKSGAKKGSTPAKSAAPAAPASSQGITVTVAVLIGVIGILLGVVLGIFVGKSLATPAITAQSSSTGLVAPQLTQEQLSSGQLPAGHPQINTSGTVEATAGK
jgi:hypothetical protein